MINPIPVATVARLSRYLAIIGAWSRSSISSEDLAVLTGSNPAQVRKDLGYIGAGGTRGVGYDTTRLTKLLSKALGLEHTRGVVIVGAGNLGQALAGYPGFRSRGFRIEGVFDVSPRVIGTEVSGIVIRHLSELFPEPSGGAIGVVAVPADAAQAVVDRLVAAGYRSILNFAPVIVRHPPGVEIRQVDLAAELHILSHHLARERG